MELHRPAPNRPASARLFEAGTVLSGCVVFAWTASHGFTTWVPFQDYRYHVAVADRLWSGQPLEIPHPLFHWLTGALHRLLPRAGLPAAGLAVVVLAQAVVLGVLFRRLRRALASWNAPAADLVAALLALGVSVLAPLHFLIPERREFYFGYLFPNTYHNPTVLLLRPLALLLSAACATAWLADRRPGRAGVACLAVLTVLSALAKPSYIICFAPAVAMFWAGQRLLGQGPPSSWAPIAGVVLPAGAILAGQWWFTAASGRMEESQIVWAPFTAVFQHTRPDVPRLALKLLLSILFPLWVAGSHWRAAVRDRELLLAWATAGGGALCAYGLAEAGPRLAHANLIWSGQVAVFVLFAVSTGFLARHWSALAASRRWPPSLLVAGSLFLLHVASGLAYAFRFVRTGQAF
jgi:hypothetical protein